MQDGTVRVTLSRGLAGTDRPIQRKEDGDKVRYTNVMLLGPGEWTDSASRTTLFYAPDAIKRSVDNWIDPRTNEAVEKAPLNHHHEYDVPSENVGHIDVSSVSADSEGHLYGDIVFHMRTQRSREMEEMMKLSMEEGGEEGLGGVSVEIPDDDTEWDDERRMERMKEMWFSGAALVMNPASATVDFGEQSKRVTALSAADDRERTLYTRDGETTKPGAHAQDHMGNDDDTPEGVRHLRQVRDRAQGLKRSLQDETDMAIDAAGTYLTQEENQREDALSNLETWAMDALEDPVASSVATAVQSYLDASGESLDEATVGDFMDWAQGADGEEPEGEPGEATGPEAPEGELEDGETPPSDVPEDSPVDDATVAEVASTLESVVETVDMAVSELKEQTGAVEESVEEETAELSEQVSELERRLEEYEDEGQPRTLGGGTVPSEDEDDSPETTAPTPQRTSDGYISR